MQINFKIIPGITVGGYAKGGAILNKYTVYIYIYTV